MAKATIYQEKLLNEVNSVVDSYKTDEVEIVDGLNYNQFSTIRTIEFYSNSKYLEGSTDVLERDKPFYNITNFRVNVATRATDLDVKDIDIQADHPKDIAKSFLIEKEVRNWEKDTNFSKTLNKIGHTRAKYGGVLVKKVKQGGSLDVEVVPWKNVVTDQVDIMTGAVVEIHHMSPVQLEKMRGVWDDEAIDKALEQASKVTNDAIDNSEQSNSDRSQKKVRVLEFHGELSEDYFSDDGDEDSYVQKVCFIAGDVEGEQSILFQDDEDELPYKYLPWRDVDGRALGVGVVEDGIEAQVWTNDAMIAEKNVMDLAGKVIFKTDSRRLGENILTDMPSGQILELEEGKDLQQVNATPSSIGQFQNILQRWDTQYDQSASTFEAVTGETLPSGTPFRSVAIQNTEANSHFSYRREEFGIFVKEIYTEWVIPHVMKGINKEHILSSEFTPEELAKIDTAFANYTANNEAKKRLLNGQSTTQEEYEALRSGALARIGIGDDRRYLDIPKDFFKNIKYQISVITTGEQQNKQAELESMFNLLTLVIGNPQVLQDPTTTSLVNSIIEKSGMDMSPLSLTSPAMQAGDASAVPDAPSQQTLQEQVAGEQQDARA